MGEDDGAIIARQRMDVADLASDLATDAQLAAAYHEGRDEAGRWLQHFPSMLLERASTRPTPTGRRMTFEQARKALLTSELECQHRDGGEADEQLTWCRALIDSLPAGGVDAGHDPRARWMEDRPRDELDDAVRTAHNRRGTTPTPLPSLDVLRSEPLALGDEDDFTALIEAANGHDDQYDPRDDRAVAAMEGLMDDDVLEIRDTSPARPHGRVRNELSTHMLWGYRVGRYLLMTHRRRPLSANLNCASYAASELVSHVCELYKRRDVVDLVARPDLSAALHYHPVSSTLRRACDGDKSEARAWVTLMEDLGFLAALGAEDLSEGATLHADETWSQAVDTSAGAPWRQE